MPAAIISLIAVEMFSGVAELLAGSAVPAVDAVVVAGVAGVVVVAGVAAVSVTAPVASGGASVGPVPSPSAARVSGPTMPSGVSPCADWNAWRAATVPLPKVPSVVIPSACWSGDDVAGVGS